MKKGWKKTLAVLALCSLVIISRAPGKKEEECPYEDFIVVDVFDSLANVQGIQSGWFAKIVKDKFNMELNIIAPNVSGGGDTLFEVRSAAGNLGDLIICPAENGALQDMVTAGLLIDMEPLIKDRQIMRFESAIRDLNGSVSQPGIYAIPSEVSLNSPQTPMEDPDPIYGPYVRWDLYKKLGYPKMDTLEDLLPVLKQMQELEPTSENGDRTYAFSFFKDWDSNLMNAVKQPCCFYGYDEYGFVLVKADSSDYQSIIEPDSLYMRVLKLYFDANQMGLVDPESSTQSYESFENKYKEGQILFCTWPWVAQPAYNTEARVKEGKGFMMADINDMVIYSYGCSSAGNQKVVMSIGSQAEDPKRLAAFIDWLYSPEGIRSNRAQTSGGMAGPEGLCWEYGEDGPVLTDFGNKALMGEDVEVPGEWGSGTWSEGISTLNYSTVASCELDDKGYPYAYLLWDSVRNMDISPLEQDWRDKMGADSAMEYLKKNNKLLVSPGTGYMAPQENSEMSAIRRQCRKVIQEYSWNMVFADDEQEFNRLYDQMYKEVMELGYETMLEVDLQNAKAKEAARWEAVERFEENNRGAVTN